MWNTSEYKIWGSMKARCHNEKSSNYKNYGARGITVCDEWLNDFSKFYQDMGPRPTGHSIDRIDNSKGYFKENCQWSNRSVQNLNRRKLKGNSKYKGVSFSKSKMKYRVYLRIKDKTIHLGYFRTEKMASFIRDHHSLSYYKNKDLLNNCICCNLKINTSS